MAEDDDRMTWRPEVKGGNEMSEDEIDSNLEGTFPASDPPSWTLGTNHGRKAQSPSGEGLSKGEGADVIKADDEPEHA